jgi:peptide deformylase
MIYPIYIYDNSILRQPSEEILKDFDIKDLISNMFETMLKAKGIGLSAIQIGLPLRTFVIEAHLPQENFNFRGVFINPKIKNKSDSIVKHVEGCLSIPQLTALVDRPEIIELEYYDENWKHNIKSFYGFESRIIQHEMDHLDGKLYIDHIDNMWKELLTVPLEMIKNKKIEPTYLFK